MNAYLKHLLSFAGFFLLVGCTQNATQQNEPAQTHNSNSVWSVDLIRTLPGQQDEYLRNIENNWANARRIARARGAVRSYRALVAVPDSARGWDVLLMTEYADSASWSDREAIFEAIFTSDEYVRVPMSQPSSAVREFLVGGLVMESLVSEAAR